MVGEAEPWEQPLTCVPGVYLVPLWVPPCLGEGRNGKAGGTLKHSVAPVCWSLLVETHLAVWHVPLSRDRRHSLKFGPLHGIPFLALQLRPCEDGPDLRS